MYGKIFASLYQGTLRGRAHEILVFTNMIASADSRGIVDKHPRAIAEEVGLSIDEVKSSCLRLEAPDPESRSPEEGGARIVRLDGHREWGWLIVNYAKYRAIRNEEDRREANRRYQEEYRKKRKGLSADVRFVSTGEHPSATVSHGQPRSAQAEAEAEAEAEADTPSVVGSDSVVGQNETSKARLKPAPATDEEFFASLRSAEAYQGIDINREKSKCEVWCANNRKAFSRRRFINWLNRADKPIGQIPLPISRRIAV